MASKPDSVHPLAKYVRTRRDRMKNEASVLERIEPVRNYLNDHVDQLVRTDVANPYKRTMALLIRITACLGLYDDAKLWLARYDAAIGDKSRQWAQSLDYWFDEGRFLRGDYRLSLNESDAPWDSQDQVKQGAWIAHVALMNGDLDASDALLQRIAIYRAGQPGEYVWGLRQNCELAVLAHVMGRDDLVLPALNRARYAFEPGAEMSTRPLEESPNWIGNGEEEHASLYLVHAIAGSGFGNTALELSKGRDLVTWGGKMREAFDEFYHFTGFYLCLANGGCLTEGLEYARKDPDFNLDERKKHSQFGMQFLTDYSATAFRWGEPSMGDQLAQKMIDELESIAPICPLWDTFQFLKEMEAVGQTKWAEKTTRLLLQVPPDKHLSSSNRLDFLRLLAALPANEQAAAIKDIQQRKELGAEGTDFYDSPARLNRLYEETLAALGVDPEPEVSDRYHCVEVVSNLHDAGQFDAARRLLHALVADISTKESHPKFVKLALTQCAKLGEMKRAVELVHSRPSPISGFHHLAKAYAEQEGITWADAFAWARELPCLDDQLAACAGILEAAAQNLTLRSDLKYRNVSGFPNGSVISKVGLFPYVLEGIGIGC